MFLIIVVSIFVAQLHVALGIIIFTYLVTIIRWASMPWIGSHLTGNLLFFIFINFSIVSFK